jgi:DNA-binding HxlR family transcriptional regulator
MAQEEDVLNFAASSIASIWALELLLLVRQDRRAWTSAELMRQLRGSDAVLTQCLHRLQNLGLVSEEAGSYLYKPGSLQIDVLANELENLYRLKPVTVISAIANAPQRKLQILSDAFRLKKD